jgi:hypothetical protein
MNRVFAGIVCAAVLAAPAQAGPLRFAAAPQDGVTTVQWLGNPKLIQQRQLGKVSVVPRGLERGRMAFEIEVHNLSDRAAFFGQDSVEVHAADEALALANPQRIERQAKKSATWTRIGVAVAMIALVGVAAAASGPRAAGRNYFYMPPAAPRRSAAAPPPPVSEQALPESTSVPSRHLYTGRILVERPKGDTRRQDLKLLVSFNGEQYPFAFEMNKSS